LSFSYDGGDVISPTLESLLSLRQKLMPLIDSGNP
jgi:hypothetical protein